MELSFREFCKGLRSRDSSGDNVKAEQKRKIHDSMRNYSRSSWYPRHLTFKHADFRYQTIRRNRPCDWKFGDRTPRCSISGSSSNANHFLYFRDTSNSTNLTLQFNLLFYIFFSPLLNRCFGDNVIRLNATDRRS